MRVFGLIGLALLSFLGGCSIIERPKAHSISFLDRLRPGDQPRHGDLITLEVALVQRPIYDAFLAKELWSGVDEQVGSLLARSTLQLNGLRVGELGGASPSEFQHMITSDRSCTNPRHITIHSGAGTKLLLGPVRDHAAFEIIRGTDVHTHQLDKVQFELMVTATLTDDGRTILKCLPQVHYGDETTKYCQVLGGYWLPQPEQQVATFPDLEWEITASPTQFVVIGGRDDSPDSFGNQCFFRPGEDPPVRSMLVIRAIRATSGLATPPPATNLPPVLAIQAADSANAASSDSGSD